MCMHPTFVYNMYIYIYRERERENVKTHAAETKFPTDQTQNDYVLSRVVSLRTAIGQITNAAGLWDIWISRLGSSAESEPIFLWGSPLHSGIVVPRKYDLPWIERETCQTLPAVAMRMSARKPTPLRRRMHMGRQASQHHIRRRRAVSSAGLQGEGSCT